MILMGVAVVMEWRGNINVKSLFTLPLKVIMDGLFRAGLFEFQIILNKAKHGLQ